MSRWPRESPPRRADRSTGRPRHRPGHALGTGPSRGRAAERTALAGRSLPKVTDPARFSVDHSDASRVTTGADGSFRFELPAGAATRWASASAQSSPPLLKGSTYR